MLKNNNIFVKSTTTNLISKAVDNFYKINKRNMFTTHNLASKTVNMNLIRNAPNSLLRSRNMACFHGAKFKPAVPKPTVHDIDVTGYHPIITKTTCAESNCKSVNCADPNDKNANCPSRTAQQNQASIPPTTQGFKTEVAANLTGKIPANKNGAVIDPNQNYAGQNKAQQMVVETTAVTVSSNDLNIHNKSNAFVQGHHNIIDNNIP